MHASSSTDVKRLTGLGSREAHVRQIILCARGRGMPTAASTVFWVMCGTRVSRHLADIHQTAPYSTFSPCIAESLWHITCSAYPQMCSMH